jgi:hypothetical protein
MINDAFHLSASIAIYAQQSHLTNLIPSNDEWIQLSHIKDILEVFDQMTTSLSQKKPLILNSLAIYYRLYELLNDIIEKKGKFSSFSQDIISAVEEANKKFKKYYDIMDSSDIFYLSATLDPRLKAVWLKDHLKAKHSIVVNQIMEKIKSQYHVESLTHNMPTSPILNELSYSALVKRVQEQSVPKCDIDQYYNSSPVLSNNMNDDINYVLGWWNSNQKEYPSMSKAARDFLAIPAATVTVERLFNTGRDIIGIRRQNMCSETFKWIMFLKDHFKQFKCQ